MSKSTAKYPSGAIKQHKALATGAPLQKANKANKSPGSGWNGNPPGAGSIESSGDTGGPKAGRVPKSTFTPA
jgi:hypothetical protein